MHLNGKNYLIEHDTILEVIKMIDKNYWLKEWCNMMCHKMLDITIYNGKICCNTPDGYVTCNQCRYYIEEGD